jgi:hypothetical protein
MNSREVDTEQQANSPRTTTDTESQLDCVRRRVQRRSARIERREIEEAFSELEADGDLTDEQRRTVRLLGTTLARRVTPDPTPTLERDDRDDEAVARSLARLFDVALECHLDTALERS